MAYATITAKHLTFNSSAVGNFCDYLTRYNVLHASTKRHMVFISCTAGTIAPTQVSGIAVAVVAFVFGGGG